MRTHGRSLAAPPLCTIFLLLVNVFTVAHSLDVDSSVEENIDYLDNDLAKVCRPVDRPLDLLFILDGSGSTVGGGALFATQIETLNKIVDTMDIGEDKTRIGVMQYASYTYVEFPFKAYKDKGALRDAIKNIRHKLGTTKTGKALDKATQLFNDPSAGSRKALSAPGKQVAQVAIVVSDGHSHDDPVPAALRLRQSGVHLMALAIGTHINAAELLQLTGDADLVFHNLSVANSMAHFTETLRMRFAISESCEYSRGAKTNGADIRCGANGVSVEVTLRAPFQGHFFVEGKLHDRRCRWSADSSSQASSAGMTVLSSGGGDALPQANNNNTNNASSLAVKAPTNISGRGGSDISLLVPFDECDVERQFSADDCAESVTNKTQSEMNPKGYHFHTTVVLQFHPLYGTAKDKRFIVRCFYADDATHDAQGSDANEAFDWQLIREHTQRKIKAVKRDGLSAGLPCSAQIMRSESSTTTRPSGSASAQRSQDYAKEPLADGGGGRPLASADGCQPPTTSSGTAADSTRHFSIGDRIQYKWDCDSDNFDPYQSILVHSCFLTNSRTNETRMIIDESGCTAEPALIETPRYIGYLNALSEGVAVRLADDPLVRMRCMLKFCDRLTGKCDGILPPVCDDEPQEAIDASLKRSRRRRRQAAAADDSTRFAAVQELSFAPPTTTMLAPPPQPPPPLFVPPPPLVTFDRSKLERNKALLKRRGYVLPAAVTAAPPPPTTSVVGGGAHDDFTPSSAAATLLAADRGAAGFPQLETVRPLPVQEQSQAVVGFAPSYGDVGLPALLFTRIEATAAVTAAPTTPDATSASNKTPSSSSSSVEGEDDVVFTGVEGDDDVEKSGQESSSEVEEQPLGALVTAGTTATGMSTSVVGGPVGGGQTAAPVADEADGVPEFRNIIGDHPTSASFDDPFQESRLRGAATGTDGVGEKGQKTDENHLSILDLNTNLQKMLTEMSEFAIETQTILVQDPLNGPQSCNNNSR